MVHRNFQLDQATHPERLYVLNHINEAQVIYDMGCGTHKTTPYVIGVDIRPVTDFIASCDDVPFENETAHVIISRHSLEHMLDQTKTIKEWLRVLRSGGKIIIILPDHGSIDTMLPIYGNGEHLHAYTMESFKNFISLFPELHIEEIGIILENWSFGAILRKVEKQ